ncbi:S-adenosyl-L-methionine-dependent methyltransferase [Amylocarpus encephaloides]|uniref:S-adenosyl-L-methionine-dependent methyltransferase n=1 Tax=Amylocarpus encephaloides TaxID=45428 RepID=A0A9P7YTQ6_9HELO|nr:S-adenosyl-L-methionine-dependent methyltransferase [Amylocarpus encephaloides]
MEPLCRRGLESCFNVGRCRYTGWRMLDCARGTRHLSTTCPRSASKNKRAHPKPSQPPLEYRASVKSRPRPRTISVASNPNENPFKYRIFPIIWGGITLFCISGYCAYLYVAVSRPSERLVATEASLQADVSGRYNEIAKKFDTEVDWTEKVMGIKSLRKKMTQQAVGEVLEVSIGTGRNLEYYEFDFGNLSTQGGKRKVKSLTAIDMSAGMLEVAHDKFSNLFPGILGVRWIVADAAERAKIPPPPRNANERSGNKVGEKYDTIIQTMGLCSVDNPVALLKSLGEVVKEDEGRILLLEHGRGTWSWLNNMLDKSAEGHANAFGCWWNRDLRKIVQESGLEVVKFETRHLGTTSWIELKKPTSTKAELPAARRFEPKEPPTITAPTAEAKRKYW